MQKIFLPIHSTLFIRMTSWWNSTQKCWARWIKRRWHCKYIWVNCAGLCFYCRSATSLFGKLTALLVHWHQGRKRCKIHNCVVTKIKDKGKTSYADKCSSDSYLNVKLLSLLEISTYFLLSLWDRKWGNSHQQDKKGKK